jgi:hypothetical protein
MRACDYLSAASKAINSDERAQKTWMDEQKNRLKTQQANAVLEELQAHLEPPAVEDGEAPVRQCHRYIVQQRMKRPGA